MDVRVKSIIDITQTKCKTCGGIMEYDPESRNFKCVYCGAATELDLTPIAIEENDLNYWLGKTEEQIYTHLVDTNEIKCRQCGVSILAPFNNVSIECVFCGTPLILNDAEIKSFWQPEYILPFTVGKKACVRHFLKSLKHRWFIPNQLKKNKVIHEAFKGVYLPFWTFDADTKTVYEGQRGINRTEIFQNSKGKEVKRIVTDWTYVSGVVEVSFDDVIVPGTDSLPLHIINKLTNWDRKSYLPFREEFLAGFVTDTYNKDFKQGWNDAEKKMRHTIDSSIRNDIGGDKQKINFSNVNFENKKFKLVLLPVWMSSFQFNNKKYQFVINGRTGEVLGEYPKSITKILVFIMVIIAIALALIMILEMFNKFL